IRPCAVNGVNQVSYGPTSESISGLVLRSNAFPWTAGHMVEQSISPYSFVYHGIQVAWAHYGPVGRPPDMVQVSNLGYQQARHGIEIGSDSQFFDGITKAGYWEGISFDGTTENGTVRLVGRDMSGTGIALGTSASPDDYHKICWGGAHNG